MKRLTGLALLLSAAALVVGCKKPMERVGKTYPVVSMHALNCEGCPESTDDYFVSYVNEKGDTLTAEFQYRHTSQGYGHLEIKRDARPESNSLEIDSTQRVNDVLQTKWTRLFWAKLHIPQNQVIYRRLVPLPHGT
jgi:hypothetical protein